MTITLGTRALVCASITFVSARKDFELRVVPPNQEARTILKGDWNFDWQMGYQYAEPIVLTKGTKLQLVSHFDNSVGNRANPDPTKRVLWGPQNWDEMSNCFIGVLFDVHIAPETVFLRSGPSLLPRGENGPTVAALNQAHGEALAPAGNADRTTEGNTFGCFQDCRKEGTKGRREGATLVLPSFCNSVILQSLPLNRAAASALLLFGLIRSAFEILPCLFYTALRKQQAEIHVRGGILGPVRARVRRRAPCDRAGPAQQDRRQIRERRQVIGIAAERAFVLGNRIVQPAHARQHESQVVVRERVIDARERAAQIHVGLVEPSEVAQAAANLTEHLIVAGHQLLVAQEQLERLFVAALRPRDESKFVDHVGVVRVELERASRQVFVPRRVEIARGGLLQQKGAVARLARQIVHERIGIRGEGRQPVGAAHGTFGVGVPVETNVDVAEQSKRRPEPRCALRHAFENVARPPDVVLLNRQAREPEARVRLERRHDVVGRA